MYQGKVRIRVCGLLIQEDRLLLLKHEGVGSDGFLWSPPGGGIEFGEDAKISLKREFLEETGLEVKIEEFLFLNEHIDDIHHALELFFNVKQIGGQLALGADPEQNIQILSDIQFFSHSDIRQLRPSAVHSMLSRIENLKELQNLSGYFKFTNFDH